MKSVTLHPGKALGRAPALEAPTWKKRFLTTQGSVEGSPNWRDTNTKTLLSKLHLAVLVVQQAMAPLMNSRCQRNAPLDCSERIDFLTCEQSAPGTVDNLLMNGQILLLSRGGMLPPSSGGCYSLVIYGSSVYPYNVNHADRSGVSSFASQLSEALAKDPAPEMDHRMGKLPSFQFDYHQLRQCPLHRHTNCHLVYSQETYGADFKRGFAVLANATCCAASC